MHLLKNPLARLGLASATVALAASSLVASPAHAADPTPVNIVGTSDVSDSNLMQAVIKPGFEAAYPQYQLNYVGEATGAAITDAEAGNYDGIIVHAASLENQFVSQGYSEEPYGRAIFWGDFVLAGPASDPAGVMSGTGSPSHDIVTAFEKIAAAGAAGKATFVSRGGTPGTTVAEHAIWALADPSKVTTCTVSSTDGGGATPSSTTGDCGAIATVKPPSWYAVTGAKQGANVIDADQCNTSAFPNGNCYVFTDRGTFEYLESETPPAISNLQIVTRDNDASARGGITALVNSFHGYVVNPAKFPGKTFQTAGATDLLNWITSPAGQKAIGAYLQDSGGAAFLPDAAPTVTPTKKLPTSVTAGKKLTLKGSLTNNVPGTPALNGVKISVVGTPVGAGAASVVASGKTDATGDFSLSWKPTRTMTYSVSTPQINKVENATLDPKFEDTLQAASTALTKVTLKPVKSSVTLTNATLRGTRLTIGGRVSPAASTAARITILKAKPGKALKAAATHALKANAKSFTFGLKLGKGTWRVKLRYAGTAVKTSNSKAKTVTVK